MRIDTRRSLALCVGAAALVALLPRAGLAAPVVIPSIPLRSSEGVLVDMGELARAPRPNHAAPRVAPGPALPDVGSRATPPPAGPSAPQDESAASPPSVTTSFQAIGDNNTFIPPDAHGAVGPSHVMTSLNSEVRIQTKAGSTLSTVSLAGFWSSIASYAFDPRTLYDPYSGRWIMISVTNAYAASSALLLAVSTTSDPTGTWCLRSVDADAADTVSADFPTLGFNKDWIASGNNMYTNSAGSFVESRIYVFPKAAAYASCAAVTVPMIVATGLGHTHQPAVTHDAALSTLYLMNAWSPGLGQVRIFTLTGSVSSPALTAGSIVTGSVAWSFAPAGFVDFAPQYGTSAKIQTNDARTGNVVYRNGTLWMAHTVFFPSGGSPTRASVQWWEVTTVGGIVQRGLVDDATGATFYAFPSIAVNASEDVAIGYSRYSASSYASAAFSFRAASDPASTLQASTLIKAGEASYYKTYSGTKNRWGDYSATVVDPVNDTDFWTIQEYAWTLGGGYDRWSTWWVKIAPGGAPAVSLDTTSLSHGSVLVGTTGTPKTVTLTNTGTATLTVGTITIGGAHASQFAKSSDSCSGASVAVGGSCSVGTTFIPSSVGAKSATLDIPSDAPGSPHAVALTGTGVQPAASFSATSITFDPQRVGTASATRSVTVTNAGTATLTLGTATLGGADAAHFSKTSDTCSGASVAPGGTCALGGWFSPTSTGAKSASLTITSNAPGSPHAVVLSGTGTEPVASLSTTTLGFGTTYVGVTSDPGTVTLSNTGTASMAVGTLSVEGSDFSLAGDECSGATLDPTEACDAEVAFAPSAAGARAGTLRFPTDAAGSPHTVALSGTGAVDATAPGSAFTTPNGSFVSRYIGSGRLAGTTTDTESGVAGVDVIYTPLAGGAPATVAATLACSSPPVSCSWTAGLPPLAGVYTAEARGRDRVGNVEMPGPRITVLVV